MLGLKKSVRFHGLPKHPNIIFSSKTSSRSFATAISTGRNLSVFSKGVAALPAHNKKSTAAFSTQPHGLRKLLYRDDPWSPEMKKLDPYKARIAFLKTNPFNDAAAHNCCLRFKGVARHEDDYTDGKTVRGWFDMDIDILQDELKQLVRLAKKADNTEEWPMVMMFNELSSLWPTGTFEIVFKVPGRFDPQSFFWRLRDQHLVNGEFVTAKGALSQGVDRWWHHFLYCLPEEQKYWLHGSGEAQAAFSTEDHRPYTSTRQSTVRNRYGRGRKPAVIIKNRPYATTTLGLLTKRPMFSTPFACDKKIAAPFSTCSHGLRKALWAAEELPDLVFSRPPLALLQHLPYEFGPEFGNEGAHNCVLIFQDVHRCFNPFGKLSNPHLAMLFLQKETKTVQSELNKVTKLDEVQPEWPVVVGLHVGGRTLAIHIAFKLPSDCDPKVFKSRLRKAGLAKCGFWTLKRDTMQSNWWHKLFSSTSPEQQYWSWSDRPPFQAISTKTVIPTEAEKLARRYFMKNNPFDDPLASNCVLTFDNAPTLEQLKPQVEILAAETEKVLVLANRRVQSAQDQWPVVKMSNPPSSESHLFFKVPSSESPQAFEARLRAAGLADGKFQELGSVWDQWWFEKALFSRGKQNLSMGGSNIYTVHVQKHASPAIAEAEASASYQAWVRSMDKKLGYSRYGSKWNKKTGRRSYATASKDHSTKPTLVIEYRTIPVEEKEAAAATWDSINPFNEPLARNCALIIENTPLIRDEDGKLEHSATHRQFDEQSGLVLEEMGKVLKAAGNKAHWPTLGKLQDARTPLQDLPYDFHVYFRIPASEGLEAFEARLRKAGLEDGYLEDLGRDFDKWWHATLWGMAKGGFSIPADMNTHD